MISAANPYATRAGLEMLRKGGSAVDAAIAAQMVLTLVEPESSGIGGGAFLLLYDAKQDKVTSFDGRETAPASATPGMFLDAQGKPRAHMDAIPGGLSVGVPGVVAMLRDGAQALRQAALGDAVPAGHCACGAWLSGQQENGGRASRRAGDG